MRRIYHHYEKWECYPAGFYETTAPDGMNAEQAQQAYAEFLGDLDRFESALQRVLAEWTHSCDQFLSNEHINRIAWLGQAAMCIETRVPSVFRGGFKLLTLQKQRLANAMAQKYLDIWARIKGDELREQSETLHQPVGSLRLF